MNYKTNNIFRALAAGILLTVSAPAATLWWDGGTVNLTGNGNGASGGTAGTWDNTIVNWDTGNGLPYAAWNNITNAADTAYFAGTTGTITLGFPITAGGITVTVADTIANGGLNITLNNTGTAISASAAATFSGTGNLTVNAATQTWACTSGTTIISCPVSTGANLLTLNVGSNNLAVTGKISGSGGLNVNSTYNSAISPSNGGSPALNNTNNYTGTTTIAGFIWLNSGGIAALGADTSNIVLNAGGFRLTGSGTTNVTRGLSLTGACGVSLISGNTSFNAKISGTGSFNSSANFSSGATSILTVANDFTGDCSVGADGKIRLAHVSALASSTLNADPGTRGAWDLTTNNLAYIIGGLKGYTNLAMGTGLSGSGSGTVSFGNNGQSNYYSGALSGTAGFTKIGAGTQTFYGVNAYTGPTSIQAGTLKLGTVAATGPITVTGTSGNGRLTAITGGTSGLVLGQAVTGTNIAAGAVILSIDSSSQVTLSANNTGTVTAASFGTLTGSLPATNTTVGGSGTLMGVGTVNGPLIVQAGGTVQPTLSGTPGTLTLASATSPTFAANCTLKFRIPTATTADKISLTNASAAVDCTNIDLVIDATGLPANASGFTLLQTANGAGITGTFHSVNVISSLGYAATVHYNASSVTVDIAIPVFHLAISSVNGGTSPFATTPFSVTVQSLNGSNSLVNVTNDTAVTLSVATGTGSLGGTYTGTITAGTNNVVISGVTYSKAENGVVLTATRTSGDTMDPGNSSSFNVINPPATITLTSGDGQNASFGTALTNPFVVTVTDGGGAPVPGVGVTFAIATTPVGATGQSLSTTTATTNLSGQASSILTLGNITGIYTVTATSGTLTNSPLTFTATATAYTGNIYWDGGITDILTNGNGASDGGAGTWDTTIRNWDTGANPHALWDNTGYAPATAVFAGTAGAVTLGANDITVGKLAFAGAYTLAGNSHNLTLTGTGTTINGGTLSGFNTITLGADQTWSTTISGGAVDTNGYTLSIGNTSSSLVGTTYAPVIGGTGNLALTGTSGSGSNTATLNTANTFSGTATLTGTGGLGDSVKTIVISSLKNAGTNSEFGTASTLTLNNAVIQTGGSSTSNRTINITGNCGFYVKGNFTQTLSGSITGSGVLCSDGDYSGGLGGSGNLILTGNNSFTGTMKLVDDGRVTLGNVNALTNATLDTSGTRSLADLTTYNLAYVIGGLKGTGNLNLGTGLGASGSGIVTFGGNNLSNSFSGVLSGTAGFTKTGSGIQTFSGINTYTGNTIVNSGTLALTSTGGLKFVVTNTTNNKITGNGTATTTLDGAFAIDTTAVTNITGSWTLVEIANAGATFTSNFTVTGFTAQPDGVTWQLVNGAQTWTFSKSTGTLTLVTAGMAYETWAAAMGLTGSNNGRDQDPDGDGASNLLEFALAGDPLSGSNNGISLAKLQDVSGNQALTLTIATRAGATFATATDGNAMEAPVDSIVYRIEGTHNLTTWTDSISEVTPAITTGLPSPAPTGYEYHTFMTAGPVSGTPADYIRVKVTSP